jgi:ribosomal-protein-alanine N-acetyltransferase
MPFIFRGGPLDLHSIVIDADRIQLKAITRENTEEIYENFTPEITRYMMPAPPKKISETTDFVESALSGLERGDDLHLVIYQRGSNEFLGVCGLHERGRPAEPKVGIWLKKGAHGNGYGFEAIVALQAWAENCMKFERLVYPVDRRNTPSKRIPETLGGRIIAERKVTSMAGVELDEIVYGIERVAPSGS